MAIRVFLAVALLIGSCAARAAEPISLQHTDLIKRGDTVLWIGDELLQDADWPLFVEAGLLAARPDDAVTWYRAGSEGSTAEVAALWGSRIVMTIRASLVFACFGQAESEFLRHPMPPGFAEPTEEDLQAALAKYEEGLDLFVDAMLSRSVRTVVIVSPPAVDELEPASHGFYVGMNATLALFAERAREVAQRRELPFIDLFTISSSLMQPARSAGVGLTEDGRTATDVGSVLIGAELLHEFGLDRAALLRRQWRPATEPAYTVAQRIDPSLAPPEAVSAGGSFAVAQALRVFDTHFLILWRDMDRLLHPDHANRADILSKHRAEVDADWRRVREVVNENRALKPDGP